MMPMSNNPMQMLMQMMQGGGNPMSFFDQMGRNNPQVQQFNQMIRGKNSNQLCSMAENIAKERGIDLDQFIKQMQNTFPRGGKR